jgi:hypothetical protein
MFTFYMVGWSPKLFAILLVADLLQPVDVFAIERFRDRDMRHRCRRCGAMPVLLARGKPDDVAGTDFFNRSALTLRPPASSCDDDGLPQRMRVSHGSSARLEGHLAAANPYRVAGLK